MMFPVSPCVFLFSRDADEPLAQLRGTSPPQALWPAGGLVRPRVLRALLDQPRDGSVLDVLGAWF